MRTLYILYDSRCGVCCQIKRWLEREPSYLPLRLLAAGSPEAVLLFPRVPREELVVIADTGESWFGDNAFVITLWALRRYRNWSLRFASPALRPLARRAYAALTSQRYLISRLLHLDNEGLAAELASVPLPACEVGE